MKIKAYAWMADVHCIECTRKATVFTGNLPGSHRDLVSPTEHKGDKDENGLALDLTDREGNVITPIFSTDECPMTHCGDCHQEL